MPYVIGTVYRIYYKLDPNIQYVGSTYSTLTERLEHHLKTYEDYLNGISQGVSICAYFMFLGVDNFEIEKIKDYLVYREHEKDHKHINAYEQLWINKLKCVNERNSFNPLRKNKRYHAIGELINKKKRRKNETPEAKAERLQKDREYNAKYRAKRDENETEEERKERLRIIKEKKDEELANETPEKKAERLRIRREKKDEKLANETPEEKAERLQKNREYQNNRNKDIKENETEEEKKERLRKQNDIATKSRLKKNQNESEEQKKARKQKRREDDAKKRANETEEQKKARLEKQNEATKRCRAKKKEEREAQQNLMANAELKTI